MAADQSPQPPAPEREAAPAKATSSTSSTSTGSSTTVLVLQRVRRLLRQQAPVAVVLAELRRLSLESESDPGGWTAWEAQGLVHAALLADPVHETFPLAADYRARFVRRLCAALEEEGAEEVAEPFLKELNALLLGGGGGGLNVQPDSYVAYECPVVTADGAADIDMKPTDGAATVTLVCRVAPRENQVGLKPWEACHVLADHLLSRAPRLCRGAHVVELGAGVGLLGLVAARCLGAARVTLTDADVEVLKYLRHNVQANESAGGGDGMVGGVVEVAPLDWAEPMEYQALLQQPQDGEVAATPKVILAADCIYDREAIPAFVSVLAWALRADPARTVVLVASTLRNPETYGLFEGEVAEQGLAMESVEVGAGGEEGLPFAAWWVEGGKGRWRYESPFYCPNRGAVRLCRIRLRKE